MKIRRLTTQIGTIVVYLGCYVGAIGLGVGQDKDKGVRVTHAEVFASIFAKISDELAESDVAVSCRIKRAYDTDIWVVATSDQHNRHFITSAETDSCIRCRLSRAAEDNAT
jgi:hypothetical protein